MMSDAEKLDRYEESIQKYLLGERTRETYWVNGLVVDLLLDQLPIGKRQRVTSGLIG